jgi:hypothetical protein
MTREEYAKYIANDLELCCNNDNIKPFVSTSAYAAAIKMSEWADQHPREGLWDSQKVIEWIKNNFSCSGHGFPLHYLHTSYQPEDIVKDLCKAMEEKE